MRADIYLVSRGLATSRNRAQELITGGRVYLISDGRRVQISKSSHQLPEDSNQEFQVEIAAPLVNIQSLGMSETQIQSDGTETSQADFVSRGGFKMQGALKKIQHDVAGYLILDVGISTGGFSDCLLQVGASRVLGIDVGHGQLAAKLKSDPRVILFEGVNARYLHTQLDRIRDALNPQAPEFDLIVVDVSFISLTLVLPQLIQYLKTHGSVLALVKPQFEVGRENLGKNGIVKKQELFETVEKKIRTCCETVGFTVEDYFESAIAGSDGNREFFVYATAEANVP